MEKAKKGKKTSKPKKSSKPKKKKGNSNLFSKIMLFILLMALLAIASFLVISGLNSNEKEEKVEFVENNNKKQDKIQKNENKDDTAKKDKNKENKVEIKKEDNKAIREEKTKTDKELKASRTLEGLWHSSEQGAYITFDEYGYRIDFSNVHAARPITGNYYIENNLITFTSDGDECNNVEGTYRITFYKKDFSMICKDDDCTKRRNILEADWEWIEL